MVSHRNPAVLGTLPTSGEREQPDGENEQQKREKTKRWREKRGRAREHAKNREKRRLE